METWQTIVVICAGVITLLTLGEKIWTYTRPVAKSDKDIKSTVSDVYMLKESFGNLKDRVDLIEKHQGKDLKALQDHDIANKVVCRALLALLDHELNGTQISQLEEAKNKIQTYLIER